jgi:hypothetical protein
VNKYSIDDSRKKFNKNSDTLLNPPHIKRPRVFYYGFAYKLFQGGLLL